MWSLILTVHTAICVLLTTNRYQGDSKQKNHMTQGCHRALPGNKNNKKRARVQRRLTLLTERK